MPSLNGKWIFNSTFTESQWTDMGAYLNGLQLSFKSYMGYNDGWTEDWEYISMASGLDFGQETVYSYTGPSSGQWSGSYGYCSRIIDILDDYGAGEDENIYTLFTLIATRIEDIDLSNTSWHFNNSLVVSEYFTSDTNIEVEMNLTCNSVTYDEIGFDVYHNSLYSLWYGDTTVYSTSESGWAGVSYQDIILKAFPVSDIDSGNECNDLITFIALINKNATYTGKKFVYKLGWRITQSS